MKAPHSKCEHCCAAVLLFQANRAFWNVPPSSIIRLNPPCAVSLAAELAAPASCIGLSPQVFPTTPFNGHAASNSVLAQFRNRCGMEYFVSFGKFDANSRPAPVGIDVGLVTVADALAQARHLLLEGRPHVSIDDGEGHSISGNELVACCNGKMELTDDLRAIPV